MVGSLQSCSPDPTTKSETTNPIFQEFFGQLEQVLQVLFIYLFGQNYLSKSIRKKVRKLKYEFRTFGIGNWIR